MLQISKANVMLKRGTRRKKIHSINYSSSDINPYNENIEKYKIFSPKTMHKLLFLESSSWSDVMKPLCKTVYGALLFADISGFTRLSAHLSAEELKFHINHYFSRLLGTIYEHSGDVIKFCGDAVIVMWPIPEDSDDSIRQAAVELAIKCSLHLLHTCGLYDHKFENGPTVTLRLHCGVGCGTIHCMCLGDNDRWEFLISGDALQQVGAAESDAGVGELCVSSEAFNFVSSIYPTSLKLSSGNFKIEFTTSADDTHHDYDVSPNNTAPFKLINQSNNNINNNKDNNQNSSYNNLNQQLLNQQLQQHQILQQNNANNLTSSTATSPRLSGSHHSKSRSTLRFNLFQNQQRNRTSEECVGDELQICETDSCENNKSGVLPTPSPALSLSLSISINPSKSQRTSSMSVSSPYEGNRRNPSIAATSATRRNSLALLMDRVAYVVNGVSNVGFNYTSSNLTDISSHHNGSPNGGGGSGMNEYSISLKGKIFYFKNNPRFIDVTNYLQLPRYLIPNYENEHMLSPTSTNTLKQEIFDNLSKITKFTQYIRLFIPEAARTAIEHRSLSYLAELRIVVTVFIEIIGLEDDFLNGKIERPQLVISIVLSCLKRFGGSLRQYVVDDKGCVVILAFGLPGSSHEDNAIRAIETTARIRHLLNNNSINCKIGITQGRVYCGLVGSAERCEYVMMGSSVNLAARFMSQATLNTIIVSHEIYSQCTQEYEFKSLAKIKAKGYVKPVAAYIPVNRINSGTGGGKIGENIETKDGFKFVGREAELSILTKGFDTFNRNGGRFLFSITGGPGVGKTWLLSKFLNYVTSCHVQILSIVADEYHSNTKYFCLRQLFDHFIFIEDISSPSTTTSINLLNHTPPQQQSQQQQQHISSSYRGSDFINRGHSSKNQPLTGTGTGTGVVQIVPINNSPLQLQSPPSSTTSTTVSLHKHQSQRNRDKRALGHSYSAICAGSGGTDENRMQYELKILNWMVKYTPNVKLKDLQLDESTLSDIIKNEKFENTNGNSGNNGNSNGNNGNSNSNGCNDDGKNSSFSIPQSPYEQIHQFSQYESDGISNNLSISGETLIIDLLPCLDCILPLQSSSRKVDILSNISHWAKMKICVGIIIKMLEISLLNKYTILTIENLHWCDAPSLEIILKLLIDADTCFSVATLRTLSIEPNSRNARKNSDSLLINSHRIITKLNESDTKTNSTLGLGRFASQYLQLARPCAVHPLSSSEIKIMIEDVISERLLQTYPDILKTSTLSQIIMRTGGSPYLVSAFILSLRETLLNGTFKGVETLPSGEHNIIVNRFDKLNSTQQLILKVASVIGNEFTCDFLSNVLLNIGHDMSNSVSGLELTLQKLLSTTLITVIDDYMTTTLLTSTQSKSQHIIPLSSNDTNILNDDDFNNNLNLNGNNSNNNSNNKNILKIPTKIYKFTTKTVQDCIYDLMLRSQKEASHNAVAIVMENIYGVLPEQYFDEIAKHVYSSNNTPKKILYLEEALKRGIYEDDITIMRDCLQRLFVIATGLDSDGILRYCCSTNDINHENEINHTQKNYSHLPQLHKSKKLKNLTVDTPVTTIWLTQNDIKRNIPILPSILVHYMNESSNFSNKFIDPFHSLPTKSFIGYESNKNNYDRDRDRDNNNVLGFFHSNNSSPNVIADNDGSGSGSAGNSTKINSNGNGSGNGNGSTKININVNKINNNNNNNGNNNNGNYSSPSGKFKILSNINSNSGSVAAAALNKKTLSTLEVRSRINSISQTTIGRKLLEEEDIYIWFLKLAHIYFRLGNFKLANNFIMVGLQSFHFPPINVESDTDVNNFTYKFKIWYSNLIQRLPKFLSDQAIFDVINSYVILSQIYLLRGCSASSDGCLQRAIRIKLIRGIHHEHISSPISNTFQSNIQGLTAILMLINGQGNYDTILNLLNNGNDDPNHYTGMNYIYKTFLEMSVWNLQNAFLSTNYALAYYEQTDYVIIVYVIYIIQGWLYLFSGNSIEAQRLSDHALQFAQNNYIPSILCKWAEEIKIVSKLFSTNYNDAYVEWEKLKVFSKKDSHSATSSAIVSFILIHLKGYDEAFIHAKYACLRLVNKTQTSPISCVFLFFAIYSSLKIIDHCKMLTDPEYSSRRSIHKSTQLVGWDIMTSKLTIERARTAIKVLTPCVLDCMIVMKKASILYPVVNVFYNTLLLLQNRTGIEKHRTFFLLNRSKSRVDINAIKIQLQKYQSFKFGMAFYHRERGLTLWTYGDKFQQEAQSAEDLSNRLFRDSIMSGNISIRIANNTTINGRVTNPSFNKDNDNSKEDEDNSENMIQSNYNSNSNSHSHSHNYDNFHQNSNSGKNNSNKEIEYNNYNNYNNTNTNSGSISGSGSHKYNDEEKENNLTHRSSHYSNSNNGGSSKLRAQYQDDFDNDQNSHNNYNSNHHHNNHHQLPLERNLSYGDQIEEKFTNTIQEEYDVQSKEYLKEELDDTTHNITPIDEQRNSNDLRDMAVLQSCSPTQEEHVPLINE